MDKDKRTQIIEYAKQEALNQAKATPVNNENKKQHDNPFIDAVIDRVIEVCGVKDGVADSVKAGVLEGIRKREQNKSPDSLKSTMSHVYIPERLKRKISKFTTHLVDAKLEFSGHKHMPGTIDFVRIEYNLDI
jgi:hypothetical protein